MKRMLKWTQNASHSGKGVYKSVFGEFILPQSENLTNLLMLL